MELTHRWVHHRLCVCMYACVCAFLLLVFQLLGSTRSSADFFEKIVFNELRLWFEFPAALLFVVGVCQGLHGQRWFGRVVGQRRRRLVGRQ